MSSFLFILWDNKCPTLSLLRHWHVVGITQCLVILLFQGATTFSRLVTSPQFERDSTFVTPSWLIVFETFNVKSRMLCASFNLWPLKLYRIWLLWYFYKGSLLNSPSMLRIRFERSQTYDCYYVTQWNLTCEQLGWSHVSNIRAASATSFFTYKYLHFLSLKGNDNLII